METRLLRNSVVGTVLLESLVDYPSSMDLTAHVIDNFHNLYKDYIVSTRTMAPNTTQSPSLIRIHLFSSQKYSRSGRELTV